MRSILSFFGLDFGRRDSSPVLPTAESRRPPYYGYVVPEEASNKPEDTKGWYYDFFEKLHLVIHQDQESLIAFVPFARRTHNMIYPSVEDETDALVVPYTEAMYKRMFDESPTSIPGTTLDSKAGQRRIVK